MAREREKQETVSPAGKNSMPLPARQVRAWVIFAVKDVFIPVVMLLKLVLFVIKNSPNLKAGRLYAVLRPVQKSIILRGTKTNRVIFFLKGVKDKSG